MSGLKYFVKLGGLSDGDLPYDIFVAPVASTQDMLKNTQLLNALFQFPHFESEMNETYFNKLSIPQHCDDDGCHGICRYDFIEYYSKHQTLLEELLSDYDDSSSTEVYAFDTHEEAVKWLTDAKPQDPIYLGTIQQQTVLC